MEGGEEVQSDKGKEELREWNEQPADVRARMMNSRMK